MQERHKDYERYFAESEESCQKYYLPYIKQHTDLTFDAHLKVLEVGCGIGGNVAPFARMGCQVSGVDIDPLSIDWAQRIFAQQQLEAKITCADIHQYGDDERYQCGIFLLFYINKKNLLSLKATRTFWGWGGRRRRAPEGVSKSKILPNNSESSCALRTKTPTAFGRLRYFLQFCIFGVVCKAPCTNSFATRTSNKQL